MGKREILESKIWTSVKLGDTTFQTEIKVRPKKSSVTLFYFRIQFRESKTLSLLKGLEGFLV